MGRNSDMKGTTYTKEVQDSLLYIKKYMGYESIAETIQRLAQEKIDGIQKGKVARPDFQIPKTAVVAKASAGTKAHFTVKDSKKDVSREGFEPLETEAYGVMPGSFVAAAIEECTAFI